MRSTRRSGLGNVKGTKPVTKGQKLGLWQFVRARRATAYKIDSSTKKLNPIATASVALPVPSYSLKVIEQCVGFKRKMDEYGGDWAMAKYIEATETQDEGLRASVMEKILAYNQEDLEATWSVLQWLKAKCP